jgi:SAM-dependent methyltransferase
MSVNAGRNRCQARTSFQGVRQIVSFNWPKYAGTAALLCVALAAWPATGKWAHTEMVHAVTLVFIVPALYWTIASIAVSHYVYDRYPLYDLRWLHKVLAAEARQWVNIHAGLDETSTLIESQIPGARGAVVDIFDAQTMTEPSIERARQRRSNAQMDVRARYDRLPFEDARFDAAFLIFAAHELRRHAERVRLFREVARVLAADGELVLMEHMRDGWNYAAFGPGALHFFSRRAWIRAAREAGLELKREYTRTPFVRVFVLRRAR